MSIILHPSSPHTSSQSDPSRTEESYSQPLLTLSATSLPEDIILNIRSILISTHQKATAARLMRCSKTFYNIFLPVLNYQTIELRAGTKSQRIFEGLMQTDPAFENAAESSNRISSIYKFSQYPFPTPETHDRKLSSLRQCEELTIHDLPSAKLLLDHQFAVNTEGQSRIIFSNLIRLQLGPDFIFALTSGLFGQELLEYILQLPQVLKPSEICLTFPATSGRIEHSSLSTGCLMDPTSSTYNLYEIDRHQHNIHDTYNSIRSIDEKMLNALLSPQPNNEYQWQPLNRFLTTFQPSNLVLHNVTTQPLPSIPSVNRYTVFFAELGCVFQCKDRNVQFWSDVLLESASLKRANRIMESLDKESIEQGSQHSFIDAELHDCEICKAARRMRMDLDIGDEQDEEGAEGEWRFDERVNVQSGGRVEKLVRGMIRLGYQNDSISEKALGAISFKKRGEVDS
ncbi:uncharacterized protein I303_105115 [Kwoniella dejecticola CBS 10117]|uniref:Uncharacterized protein n=1 Tax=Kwoniella dejecticola CBS 10117 TaxID=1296121 RepID=A0A1A6A3F0_9TREE|nr:uncharacterized protein I303_05440 [Kwoniella dejecticola CBS 10117]OBR84581.1 hypothetical protein I303_05440 [Kwoniella dejecticola CBS 10117]